MLEVPEGSPLRDSFARVANNTVCDLKAVCEEYMIGMNEAAEWFSYAFLLLAHECDLESWKGRRKNVKQPKRKTGMGRK